MASEQMDDVFECYYPRPSVEESYAHSYIIRWQEHSAGCFKAIGLFRNNKGTQHTPTGINVTGTTREEVIDGVRQQIDKLAFGTQITKGDWRDTNLDFNIVFGEQFIDTGKYDSFRFELYDDIAYCVLSSNGSKTFFDRRGFSPGQPIYGANITKAQLQKFNLKFGRFELDPDFDTSMQLGKADEVWLKMVFHSHVHQGERMVLPFPAVTIATPHTELNEVQATLTKKENHMNANAQAQFIRPTQQQTKTQFSLEDAIKLITQMGGQVIFSSVPKASTETTPVQQPAVPPVQKVAPTTNVSWNELTGYVETLDKLAKERAGEDLFIMCPTGYDVNDFATAVRGNISVKYGAGVFKTKVVENCLYVQRK